MGEQRFNGREHLDVNILLGEVSHRFAEILLMILWATLDMTKIIDIVQTPQFTFIMTLSALEPSCQYLFSHEFLVQTAGGDDN